LTKRAAALARIKTTRVERAEAGPVEIRLLGRLDYDERRVRTVTSWTSGRIDRLHVAVTGEQVRRGQVIATLYSPEVYAAQGDLIQAARQLERLREGLASARGAAQAALEATRQRLLLLGIPEAEVREMEEAPHPARSVPLRTFFRGTVVERLVDEGSYVSAGSGIYRVADLSRLWVQLDAYERDLAYLSRGQKVILTVSAYPEETFEGRVAFIDPMLDKQTRTTRLRVEVRNKGRLQPGMFAEAVVEGGMEGGGRPLVVPASAPLFTGRRSIVYVEVDGAEEPTYEARQVRLGHKMEDRLYPVIAGLREGERVVTQGAFTLDADLQIRGGASMMAGPDDSEPGELDRVVVVDERVLSSLEPVLDAYLSVAERLAEDDLEAARQAMRALEREAGRVRAPRSAEARAAWTATAEALTEHSRQGIRSADIDGARGSFEHLSAGARGLLEGFGNPLPQPVRLAYCPMAFNDRGAEWIQRGEEIDNAYFGAQMRRCGEIRAVVQPGEHLPVRPVLLRGSSHRGHDH
jgi:Cu(I)/Ag(I) efflux system membrane fusion protein